MKTRRSVVLLIVAAALAWMLGKLAAGALMSPWPEKSDPFPHAPRLIAVGRQRELGAVSQGRLLRVAFPVANHGTRRLILTERGKACCGQETPPRRLVLPPGKSLDVVVEVDTSRWFGRMHHVAEYDTNDPRTPRLTFAVTALVKCDSPAADGPTPQPPLPPPAAAR